jgi:hypothetical protein
MITFQEHLRAAAAAHDLAADILVSGFLVVGSHEQDCHAGKYQ